MLKRLLYYSLTIYAWGLALFVDRDAFADDDPVLYAATVAPAVIFILVSLPAYIRFRYRGSEVALVVLLLVSVGVACSRADFATILSVGTLVGVLIGIRHSRVQIGVSMVNTLFALSMVATGVMNAMGIGVYGLFPGQSIEDGVPWRVSMFAYNVTPSWLFALLIIAINYFNNRWIVGRTVMVLLGLYFLIFSASRTGLIILAVCIAFLIATRLIRFKDRLFYKMFIPVAVAAFVLALNAELLLTLLATVDIPWLNAVFFKSVEGVGNTEQASTSIERTALWAAHGQIFLADPWRGRGTFIFSEEVPDFILAYTTGSESFVTGLFARTGIVAALFVWFIYLVAKYAARQGDRLTYCLMIFLSISGLAYGSYIVPYDFLFLMLFGVMNYSIIRHSGAYPPQRLFPLKDPGGDPLDPKPSSPEPTTCDSGHR